MTDHERLWARPFTLTDEERERARAAYEVTPSILEALYAAALGDGQVAADSMQRLIEETRR